MRTESQVLAQLCTWGQGDEQIRAAILTSSRGDPERETDILSDYDVELYVADLEPFRKGDQWLNTFGAIMVWTSKIAGRHFTMRSRSSGGWQCM